MDRGRLFASTTLIGGSFAGSGPVVSIMEFDVPIEGVAMANGCTQLKTTWMDLS